MEQPSIDAYYDQNSELQPSPDTQWRTAQIYRLAGQVDPTTNPLSSNSTSQVPNRRSSNPKSYASRVQTRPELSVDTTSPTFANETAFGTSETYDTAHASQSAVMPSRKGSVADKSPLQKLEVALGDVSKEAKRARVQEAEQLAEERRASQRKSAGAKEVATTQRSLSGAATALRQSDGLNETTKRSISLPSQKAREKANASEASKIRSSADYGQTMLDDTRRRNRRSIASYDTPSRTRQYGHDALLSGSAAAAALGAYQSSRQSRFVTPMEYPETPEAFRTSDAARDEAYTQNADQMRGSISQPEYADRALTQADDYNGSSRTMVPSDMIGTYGGAKRSLQNTQQPRYLDHMSPQEYLFDNTDDAQHSADAYVNPNTTRRVSFQPVPTGDLGISGAEASRDQSQSYISSDHESDQPRRYQSTKTLEDWKNAGVAYLTAEDLETAPAQSNDQAWWEREASAQTRKDGQNGVNFTGNKYATAASDTEGPTLFEPNLFLKCGPLLRYTGITRGEVSNEGGPMRETWRGSVMIVTEDAKSSYDTVPTLRMFREPRALAKPKSKGFDNTQNVQHPTDRYDPVAGLSKMSREGETLYVKPVHLLQPERDLSQDETHEGLFDASPPQNTIEKQEFTAGIPSGESLGKYREVRGFKLHVERGFTFWRFNIQVDLVSEQTRVAYRINNGPTTGFWVPATGQAMNIMFHSCNGFSLSVNPDEFSGPDPLWRDVLNEHMSRPFHVMIGGGDQIYNDAAMRHTTHFQEWLGIKNPQHKHSAPFSEAMQNELDQFYLDRYSMWFSQGLFGLANSQIPMVNMWDDHDIIDGFGSYPHHFMTTPVFSGIGAVAFKYYCLFQHQSVPSETDATESSWLLGAKPGPYIHQLSRNIFMSLGKGVSLLGIDCRTERKRDEILSQDTWDVIFDRCRQELVFGTTKHLIVLLGVPIAYPRLNFLENILTSRAMDPIKALSRAGLFSGFINKFDSGVEILDDLNDHWTAKHHKKERDWFIQELQELAAEKSVRITILGGDVHLGACGRFYSNRRLGIPKDRDHRYMPNVISSAIVNTPPPTMMADIINKRDKVHNLDRDTEESMIPLFDVDVDGTRRNNNHLLPRRNWCSIREYDPHVSPPPTPPPEPDAESGVEEFEKPKRTLSLGRGNTLKRNTGATGSLFRRLTSRSTQPPSSYIEPDQRTASSASQTQPETQSLNNTYPTSGQSLVSNTNQDRRRYSTDGAMQSGDISSIDVGRRPSFHRRASNLSEKDLQRDASGRQGHIDLEQGLAISLHFELNQRDPLGVTVPYRLIVPALFYQGVGVVNNLPSKGGLSNMFGIGRFGSRRGLTSTQGQPYEANEAYDEPQVGDGAKGDTINNAGGTRSLAIEDVSSNAMHPNRPQTGISETTGEEFGEEFHEPAENDYFDAPTERAPQQYENSMDTNSQVRNTQFAEGVSNLRPVRRNLSAKGPRAPRNLKDLPASVQKRYSQYEPIENGGSLPIPSDGLGPPLGQVNNHYSDTTPRELHDSAVAGWDADFGTQATRNPASSNRDSYADPNRRSADIQQLITPAAHGRGKSKGHSRSASLRASNPVIDRPLPSDDLEANVPQRAATYHAPPSRDSKYGPANPQFASIPGPLTSAPVSASDTYIPQEYHSPTEDRVSHDMSRGTLTPSPPPQSRPSKLERHYGGQESSDYDYYGSHDANRPRPAPEEQQQRKKSTRFSSFVRRISDSGSKRRN